MFILLVISPKNEFYDAFFARALFRFEFYHFKYARSSFCLPLIFFVICRISRENENHLIDEICSVLSTFGIDMTKSEFRKMTENEFLNILNICVFCNDAYSVEWLKKNPQKVLNFFTDSDFRYKIDQKMLRTITMPHNNKLKIQVCHHICSMVILDCVLCHLKSA